MQLTHFTLPHDSVRLETTAQDAGTTLLPRWPALTDVPAQEAAWAIGPDSFLHLERQTPSRGRILLGCREGEPAAKLLEAAESRAAEWKLSSLVGYTQNNQGASMLEANGYQQAGTLVLLHADHVPQLQPLPLPSDYYIRRFDELNHIPTLAALLNRAYADRFGRPENEHKAVTVETVQANLDSAAGSQLRQNLTLILNFYGKGVAVIRRHDNDRIESPGVVPEERESGLHLQLLAHALQQQPPGPVTMLSHSDDASWTEAYLSAGFKVRQTWIGYQKDL